MTEHTPVLVEEVLQGIKATSEGRFIDGTAGGGGYVLEILKRNKNAEVLGIDLDQASLEKIKNKLVRRNLAQRAVLVHENYRNVKKIAADHKFTGSRGMILDLGFSTLQLEDPKRGFAFQNNGPLDMRYDPAQALTAEKVVNGYPEERLAKIIKEYGEEKFFKKIAATIVAGRKISPVSDTGTLAGLIKAAIPKPVRYKAADNIRRVFQAIRIEVNSELENIKLALPDCLEVLGPGGRLAVISFHSLEDRIVKNFFKEATVDCICPPDFPKCVCGKSSLARIITRKPITASVEETQANPKAKPAKLRILEKI